MVIIGNLNCNQAKGKNILKSRQLVIETRYDEECCIYITVLYN